VPDLPSEKPDGPPLPQGLVTGRAAETGVTRKAGKDILMITGYCFSFQARNFSENFSKKN
jgi:hypothetical protein